MRVRKTGCRHIRLRSEADAVRRPEKPGAKTNPDGLGQTLGWGHISTACYPFDSYFIGGNPLPVIEELNTSAVVIENGNLQVNVKARAR